MLNNLAMAYWQAKDPRALATAGRAYKLRPENPEIADTFGWMLVEQGDAARGVDLLQKAVAVVPGNLSTRYHLAYGRFKAGDAAKARIEFERLLSTDTNFPERGDAASLLSRLQ